MVYLNGPSTANYVQKANELQENCVLSLNVVTFYLTLVHSPSERSCYFSDLSSFSMYALVRFYLKLVQCPAERSSFSYMKKFLVLTEVRYFAFFACTVFYVLKRKSILT